MAGGDLSPGNGIYKSARHGASLQHCRSSPDPATAPVLTLPALLCLCLWLWLCLCLCLWLCLFLCI